MKTIYLDNNATTAVDPAVLETMLPFLSNLYGNPSSMHHFGGQVSKHLKLAREQVAACLNALPEEITFTSCGTESDSTAILSALEAQAAKHHVITTKVEHSAILALGQHLERKGYDVTYLDVDEKGQLTAEQVEAAIRPDTAIISIMYANNETGTIFPIAEIGAVARKHGVPFHVDAVQAVGKIDIDTKILPVDYLALSGHKLHAPKGVGALYIRHGAPFRPLLRGGHQERGRRAGTENVASIVALGKACELAKEHMEEENTAVRALRDKLQHGLLTAIPDCKINGDVTSRLPNTLNIAFKYIEGESILLMLDQYGICASSGSACTSGSLEPSHVLMAMGVPFSYAHGSIRFSLSRFTTEEEIDTVLRELPVIIERLRAMSPFRHGAEME